MNPKSQESAATSDPHNAQPVAPRASHLIDGKPDWDAIPFDVFCSRCGYNLRMRTEPNCPECGQTFAWRNVLDLARQDTQWLFEFHWRQRPFWSWRQTVRRAMNPGRFWQDLSVQKEVRVGPLICLLVIARFIGTAGQTGVNGILTAVYYAIASTAPGTRVAPATGPTPAMGFHDSAYVLHASCLVWTQPIALAVTLFQILLGFAVSLLVLWLLLRSYRVRILQLLRVTAYNAMPLCLWGILLGIPWPLTLPWIASREAAWLVQWAPRLVGLALATLYLSAALRHYLGVRNAGTIALVATVIMTAVSVGSGYLPHGLYRLLVRV